MAKDSYAICVTKLMTVLMILSLHRVIVREIQDIFTCNAFSAGTNPLCVVLNLRFRP
jgi:hypothetical protein